MLPITHIRIVENKTYLLDIVDKNGILSQIQVRVKPLTEPAVEVLVRGKWLWVRIFDFRLQETQRVVEEALKRFPEASLVLDLRFCGGGSYVEMLRTVSLFAPPGTVLFERRRGAKITTQARLPDVPYYSVRSLQVLISRYTASSAEMFILGLSMPFKLWGEPTKGKHTVQETQKIESQGKALEVSVSIWQIRGKHLGENEKIAPHEEVLGTLFRTEQAWEALFGRGG